MPESPNFFQEVRSVIPKLGTYLTSLGEVVVLQHQHNSALYFQTHEIWRKLGIVSDVFCVGTPEEIKFRAGVREEIAKALPTSGAYAVIERKVN